VIGGTLLTGGYGSVVGATFGALIFGVVQIGITYTNVNSDWFRVFPRWDCCSSRCSSTTRCGSA